MRYTSWQDVVARYPKAAGINTANDGNNFDTAFGLPAEATVDASLALRYSVPLANTPSLTPYAVRDVATDLAYWKMAWMTLSKEQEEILRGSIDRRLSALSTGSLALVSSAGLVAPISGGAWSTHQSFPNVTGIDQVSEWDVSSGELVAQEDVRGD